MKLKQLRMVDSSRDVQIRGKMRICSCQWLLQGFHISVGDHFCQCTLEWRMDDMRKLDINKVVYDFIQHVELRNQTTNVECVPA